MTRPLLAFVLVGFTLGGFALGGLYRGDQLDRERAETVRLRHELAAAIARCRCAEAR